MNRTMELFPYQQEGVDFLVARTGALLADTMGLGKTAQAVVAAARTMPPGSHSAILVVCPASVALNWRREFDLWWPAGQDPPALNVVSYGMLTRNPERHLAAEPTHVILDEVHYLKNPKAKRTKAVFGPRMTGHGGVIEKAKYVWCLTGTPAPNNPSELWPMLHALNPGAILGTGKQAYTPRNFWSFTRRYCVVKNNGFGEVIVRGQRLDELKERMAPFMLRRRKEEVLPDLPELRFGELPLDGKVVGDSTIETGRLCVDEDRIKQALETGGVEALNKLSTEMATVRRLTALAKVGALSEWVKEWLENCDEKIVIFAQHREAIAVLEQVLSAYRPSVVTGAVSSGERQIAVERFQDQVSGPRVFLGNIQAAGVGITLTAASDLVFLEQSWTPADNAQAAMRIHRIGQKRGCLVRVATLAGSIDEAVQRTLARKTEDLVALFDAVA